MIGTHVHVLSAAPVAGKKIKIIFNFGGPSTSSPSGDAVYDLRTQQAKELYERAGYKVVVLATGPNGNYPPTSEGLRQAFQVELAKGGVSDLSLGFFGHGNNLFQEELQGLSKKWKSNFPLTKQPGYVLGINGWGDRQDQSMAYAISSPQGIDPASADHVGLGFLRNLLVDAKKKNPSLQTTVTALNCYSGMIGLELAKEPAFNAYMSTFSSTVARSVALDPASDKLDTSKDVDYPYFFNQHLASGNSYRVAHAKASHDLLELSQKHGERVPFATIPRSQIQQFVARWCLENSGKSKAAQDVGSLGLAGDYQLAYNDLTQPTAEVSSYLENQAKSSGCFDENTLAAFRRLRQEAEELIRGIFQYEIDTFLERAKTITKAAYFKSNLAREKKNMTGDRVDITKMDSAKAALVTELTSFSTMLPSLALDEIGARVSYFKTLLSPMTLPGMRAPDPSPPRIGAHKCEQGNQISSSSPASEIIEKATRSLACLRTEPQTTVTQNAAYWIREIEEDLCKRPAPLLAGLKEDQACVRSFFSSVGKDDPAMKRMMEIFAMSQRTLFGGGDEKIFQPAHSEAVGAQ